ncbi:MAG: DUF5011 domain-containing protein, partial [Candidatus Hydrogenedentes bacterium]|nr:DUF5011 domain-containing protein [Candidatus Hydrogenedentota bacterium]
LPATSNNPVSDINFTDDGDLYTSERTIPGDTGLLHQGNRSAHASHLLKWEGTAGSYTQSVEEYKVGSIFGEANSAGGAAIDCQENVWATGDALHFGSATGHTDTVYGLQGIAAGGNAGDPATQNSYVIGLAGGGGAGFAKTEIGDVEIYQEPCSCMELEVEHVLCDLDDDGGATVTFNVTNVSGVDATRILITPQTPGLTVSPNIVNTPVPDGGNASVTVNVGGYTEGEEFCFTVTLLDATGNVCCSDEICLTVECKCLQIRRDRIVCDPQNPGAWLYTFAFDNLTPDTLEHLYLFPVNPNITFTPAYFDLPSLAPNTTSGPLTFSITGGQAGDEICFQISVHDQLLRQCCAIEVCIVLPDCCQEGPDGTIDPCCDDRIPPEITLHGPFPEIIDCGVDFQIPGAGAKDNCDGGVEVIISGTVDTSTPGQYCVTYTATDSNGNTQSVVHCVTVLGNCCNPDTEPPVISLPVDCPFSINCRDLDFHIPAASAFDNCDGDVTQNVKVEGDVDVNTPGVYCVTYTAQDSSNNAASTQCCITVLDNCGQTPVKNHAADFIRDFIIELKELLRVIQLFNSGAYHCDPTTEDGYAPGAGTHAGAPHSCDYNGQDWSISLTELLRIVQLFNAGGYYECISGEDGYCPGSAS